MKKTVHRKPKKNSKVLPIVFVGALILLIVFFVMRSQTSEPNNWQTTQAEAATLSVSPNKGCKLDPDDNTSYMCNVEVKNTSVEPMEWVGTVEGIEGAKLSNDGMGTIDPGKFGVLTLLVPVSYCETNESGTGAVSIVDGNKSTNQGKVTFNCKDDATGY